MQKIEDRTYQFALRVVKTVHTRPKDLAGRTIGRQLLRAATSIGANAEEAIGASTKREFAQKMGIAYREAREARYWLRILRDSETVSPVRAAGLIHEALEIKKIMAKTVSSAKKRARSSA